MTDQANEVRITRVVAAQLEVDDGRTIVGRCIPFDVPALVADPPDFVPYREVWRSGAFRRVVRDPARVLLRYEHHPGIMDAVASTVELVERDDGLHGTFRAIGAPGDQALELIRCGAVTGLSVEAIVSRKHSRPLEDGTVERTLAVRLAHVALTGTPAYRDAQVMAVRSGPGDELEPAPGLDEVRAWREQAALRFRTER